MLRPCIILLTFDWSVHITWFLLCKNDHSYKPTHTFLQVFIAPGYKYCSLICATVHIRARHMVTCPNPTSIGLPNLKVCIRSSCVFLAYSPLRMNILVGRNECSYLFFLLILGGPLAEIMTCFSMVPHGLPPFSICYHHASRTVEKRRGDPFSPPLWLEKAEVGVH